MTADQLRKSILQQAIQGKLVPQDPNDEPASVLLEQIRKEKARLVKEKKIKKDKNESIIFKGDDNRHYEKFADGTVKCIEEEIPFEIPESWEWCRLNELAEYRKGPFGSSLTKAMFVPKSDKAIKVYEQKNVIQKDYNLGNYYIAENKYSQMQSFEVQPLDIIVSCAGTIGESYILPAEAPIGIINQALMRIRLYQFCIADFWLLYFDYILKREANLKSAGSAIKNIPPFDTFKKMLMPIPPLSEQIRIVEQVEVIQSNILEYEILNRETSRINEEIKGQLQKSILQYAIQGKLTPQNSNDEPASMLLERIREEKKRLVKEKKIKADKHESVIFKGDDNKYHEKKGENIVCIDDEIPFEIPNNWCWCRLKDVSIIQEGPGIRSFQYKVSGVQLLTVTNIIENHIDIEKSQKFISEEEYWTKYLHFQLKMGDIVCACSGGSWGKSAVYNENSLKIILNTSTLRLRFYGDLGYGLYLYYITKSALFKKQLADQLSGMQPNFGYAHYSKILIPIPPLMEQKRIVLALEYILTSIMRG